ncbi:MAG TPA: SGNH/GDSL hydrolase family protein [Vicinamibacterales bacterium]|nr:SGNH/GDSL hydrolase family protein [Vicinamibacterales bacterium]
MAKRSRSPRRQTAEQRAAAREAVSTGQALARQVLAARREGLRRRAAAVRREGPRIRARALAMTPQRVRAAGVPAAGVLVAEGDSWFDYPMNDVLSRLEDDYGYDVESVAKKGHRVEDMAYTGTQLDDFTRTIEKLLRRGIVPTAILVSGGGNDVAGDEFGMLLDHAKSPTPGLNEDVVRGVIDQRVRHAYITILTAVTALCRAKIGTEIRMLVHGYDHPVPDGRGFAGGWGPLPGPWLEPGFRQKGFLHLDATTRIAAALIDRFNVMLRGVVAMPEFAHVRYVDLRGTLSNGPGYRRWWANELHPTPRGFAAVAEKFANAVVRA